MLAKQLIQELVSSPYEYKWVHKKFAEFVSGDGTIYAVIFSLRSSHIDGLPEDLETYDLEFGMDDNSRLSIDLTNKFDSFKVLSTVLKIVSEFLNRKNTQVMFYTDNDKLYRFYLNSLKRYASKFGLRYKEKADYSTEYIYITKTVNWN